MDDTFSQNEFTPEDLAVLQAFDALDMQNWESASTDAETATSEPAPSLPAQEEDVQSSLTDTGDMLVLFVNEVDEDLAIILRTLRDIAPDEQLDAARLRVLQRLAHKIKGTSGAIGCHAMSKIAYYMEELVLAIIHGAIAPFIGLNALVQTASALTATLNSIVTYGKENPTPLAELEAEYKTLSTTKQIVPLSRSTSPLGGEGDIAVRIPFKVEEEGIASGGMTKPLQEQAPSLPFVRVDVQRLEKLAFHTEQLAELCEPLKDAQADVEKAFQELQAAEARLRYLETVLSAALTRKAAERDEGVVQPPSSLVARILREAGQRTNHFYQRRGKGQSQLPRTNVNVQWADLEIDHFSESDLLIRSLNEAIADVSTASAQLRLAFTQLSHITQKHVNQAAHVRNDALLLRLAPISTLVTRIERAVSMSALAQHRLVQFEVEGETIEVDQDILEELKHPLLHLVRTSLASSFTPSSSFPQQPAEAERIWLSIRSAGCDILIEVGFSMLVHGGSLEEVQQSVSLLHGSITVQRNTLGGISFQLRLPRLQGAVRGLLVRVGNQHILVPFSQIQRIDALGQNLATPPVSLNALLGFLADSSVQRTVQPVLILQADTSPVRVDEVLGEVELVVKPLAHHLQRPGIIGAAIDGPGNVVLVVNLPELVRYWEGRMAEVAAQNMAEGNMTGGNMAEVAAQSSATTGRGSEASFTRRSVLVVDDSVFMRQSLLQTLIHAGYHVMEAHDGMEAWEILVHAPPHALILDLEMPNLNGFDLLQIVHMHPQLARMKIVMLSSRSSGKYQARARELGAHAYLVKPCPQETLLETLKLLLKD